MAVGESGLPLKGGYLNRVPATADLQAIAVALNDVIDRLNDQLKTQVFADTQSKRFIQGYSPGRWPGGDFGLAISAEGDDVLTVDFDSLLFAWDFSTNKQYIRGGTQLFYDPTTGLNIGQQGILPNNKGGQAWAKDGQSVDDAFAG